MIRLNTEPQPYTPPWYKAGKGPVFMIRAGGVTERELFEAEIAGDYDAGRVLDFELRAAFDSGLEALLADAPDELAELRQILAAERELAEQNAGAIERSRSMPEAERAAFLEAETVKLPDDQRQALDEADRIVRQHWPDYAVLHQRLARRNALVPWLAFRHFCADWSGLKAPCEIGRDGLVTEKAGGAVPQIDMKAAGLHAYRLLYAAGEEGNSARPSSSVRGRRTTSSDARSAQAGKSRGRAGPKTRA